MSDPITKEESKRRLLVLAEFLDTLEPEKFNFEFWGRKEKNLEVDKRLVAVASNAPNKTMCGTTACGLGWATTIPEFATLGLRLETAFNQEYDYMVPGFLVVDTETQQDGVAAACRIFGVTFEEAGYLFSPNWYLDDNHDRRSPPRHATPQELAEHLRYFCGKYRS